MAIEQPNVSQLFIEPEYHKRCFLLESQISAVKLFGPFTLRKSIYSKSAFVRDTRLAIWGPDLYTVIHVVDQKIILRLENFLRSQ
jgi:hypothetical protein